MSNDVAAKKTEPIQAGTEQAAILDEAMARIQETRLRTKGNPQCRKGCGGRGFYGIRTVPLKNGFWDAYLEICECSKKSEYAELSDQVKQLANLVFNLNETIYRHTFFGGIKTAWQTAAGAITAQFRRKKPSEKPVDGKPQQATEPKPL